jgi:hypothetical protein
MPFQPSPIVTGIGGGFDAATIMGMFGQQNTQQGTSYTPNVLPNNPYHGGVGGIHSGY